MRNPDVIFPESSNRKWKWMNSEEDLEDLEELEELEGKFKEDEED